MSAALSAAKKRRAPASIQPETPKPINQQNKNVGGTDNQGLTLPQVISLIDKRLVQLELFTKNMHSNILCKNKTNTDESSATLSNTTKDELIHAVMEELQPRFEMIADEVADLKSIVMSLQSFTMDVNKTLLQQLQSNGITTMPLFDFSKSEEEVELDETQIEQQDV